MGKQLVIKGTDFSVNAIEAEPYYLDLDYAVSNSNDVSFTSLMNDSTLYIEYDIQLTQLPLSGDFYVMGTRDVSVRANDSKFQLGATDFIDVDLNRHVFRYEKINHTITLSTNGESITRQNSRIQDTFDFIGIYDEEIKKSFFCKVYSIKQYSDNTFDESKIIHNWVPKKRMPSGVIGLYDTVTNQFIAPTVGTLIE